jgi:hypothetical protein
MREHLRFARCDLRPLRSAQGRALLEALMKNVTITIPLGDTGVRLGV